MRVGSLFAGYDGIGLALSSLWPDARPAWFVEFDQAPSRVLAHHWPDVPNYGDITTVDWAAVEPVDILTGGFPCQDLSHAGKRLGLRPGTRSGLWEHMAYAIDQLRPRMVVIENVRGLLSASAHSDVGRDCWCVGDEREPALRALGAVLGDLADLGYDAEWTSVRAADAGAPHGRFRVFVVAHPRGSGRAAGETPHGRERDAVGMGGGRTGDQGTPLTDVAWQGSWGAYAPAVARWEAVLGRPAPSPTEPGRDVRPRLSPLFVEWLMGLPEGHVTDPAIGLTRAQQLKMLGNGVVPQQCAMALRMLLGLGAPPSDEVQPLLPTPAVNDMGEGKTPADWDAWTDKMRAAHGNGNGHGKSLAIEALRLGFPDELA
jgi:DNA (cytosine-5)-methyltransferase 1